GELLYECLAVAEGALLHLGRHGCDETLQFARGELFAVAEAGHHCVGRQIRQRWRWRNCLRRGGLRPRRDCEKKRGKKKSSHEGGKAQSTSFLTGSCVFRF